MDNSIFEGKRRDNISKICSNCEVLPVRDGCLKILTEPVEVCFDRAKKLQVLNQYEGLWGVKYYGCHISPPVFSQVL